MLSNPSRFSPIEETGILAGSRVLVALEKVGSYYLKIEFQKEARKFLEGALRYELFCLDQMLCTDWAAFVLRLWLGGRLFPLKFFQLALG